MGEGKVNISIKYHIPARKMDFVNINLSKDNKIFLDPLRIRMGKTELHKLCNKKIEYFISNLLELSKKRKYEKLIEIIENLYERNETRLGYSLQTTYGKSFGENGGKNLVKLLTTNDFISSGKIEDIFDCLMMIPNIGEDKVSDLITTIIFLDLIEYTQSQCDLWKIEMNKVCINKLCWEDNLKKWIKVKTELPIYNNKAIVFVPKSFVSKKYLFSYEKLYRDVIIPLYKQREFDNIGSKFVIKYKNGKKHVLGNELRKEYPCTKYVVMDFIKKYENVYRDYKSTFIDNNVIYS